MQKKDKKIEIILIESVESGKSSYQTARELQTSPTTVRRWAKQHGLTFKGKFNNLWNK
jgi:transposase-like protein